MRSRKSKDKINPTYTIAPKISPENLEKLKFNPELITQEGKFDARSAKALYYQPDIIESIIKHRKSGKSPCQAFEAAGLMARQYHDWRNKFKQPNCPRPLQYLFNEILKVLAEDDERYLLNPDGGRVPMFYDSELIKNIIKYKEEGLPDLAAFQAVGLSKNTYWGWRQKLKTPDCPAILKKVFMKIDQAEALTMHRVVGVIYKEITENDNWKAATEFLPRRWRKEYGAQSASEETSENDMPHYNLDKLTLEEQRTFLTLGKKAKADAITADSKIKLIISLPDNKRDL